MAKEVVAARERLNQAMKRGETTKAAPKLTYKVPKTIGGAIDLLYEVRGKRFEAQHAMEKEKTQESLIELLIFEKFGKSELEGAKGKAAQASISRKDVPTIDDDEKFFGHIKKHPEDIDLLQRRLSTEACKLRFEAGKTIPGVGIFTKVSLSLTKRK